MLFDLRGSVVANVTGDDAGECAAQICGEYVRRLIFTDLKTAHIVMRRRKGLLKITIDRQAPVEIVSIAVLFPKLVYRIEAERKLLCDRTRIVNNYRIPLFRLGTQCRGDEFVDPPEIRFR